MTGEDWPISTSNPTGHASELTYSAGWSDTRPNIQPLSLFMRAIPELEIGWDRPGCVQVAP